MSLYKNRYRIEPARLQSWDYCWEAFYFITICTHNRNNYLGEIIDDKCSPTEIGKIVGEEWEKTFQVRLDMNLGKGEYVVMPNHFHAIIGIGENKYNCQSTGEADISKPKNQFAPQSKNLSSIIRGFKSAVTIAVHRLGYEFKWQARFHDHIIRSEKEYLKISEYIKTNPENWREDCHFQKNDDNHCRHPHS